MGQHRVRRVAKSKEDPTRFIYRTPPAVRVPTLEQQREMIRLHGFGKTAAEIGYLFGYHASKVASVIERGIIFFESDVSQPRCPGCGGRILSRPCVACEITALKAGA